MARSRTPRLAPITPYLANLSHDDYRVRREAIKQLAKTRNPDTVPYLIEALSDKTTNVRLNAIRALGKLRDTRSIEPLIKQFAHVSNNIANAALEEVFAFGSQAVPALIQALTDKNKYIRGCAAQVLGNLRAEEAVEPLIEALHDDNDFVLLSIVTALFNLSDSRVIQPLLALVNRDPATIKREKVRGVGYFEPNAVRASALNSLVFMDYVHAFMPWVNEYQGQMHFEKRLASIVARAERGNQAAKAMLALASDHPDADVRSTLAQALETRQQKMQTPPRRPG